ncbi:pyroglutamyl-peptidase I [Rhizosaccharibacter radicis]|uniref:Pyroglutamyl-peptidase I n=1 Tax=Rhizosaccharibacter radicis TaxID=2782605 RepID=A0ABT1VUD6_9PROT|nr:pyroglutamyl-peptidase I [Acetobacteraceae bacterium KSS12]
MTDGSGPAGAAAAPFRLLLTAFEPFGGEAVNASERVVRAVRALADAGGLRGVRLDTLILPTCFHRSLAVLDGRLAVEPFDAVLALGQASGRAGITVERVALNLDDARIPDNDGQQPVDRPVVPGAPLAYLSGLPVKAMVAAIRASGIEASVSQTAGTFVCNHLFFGVRHLAETRYPALRAGFAHVPLLPEQAALAPRPGEPEPPCLPADAVARGLAAAIAAIAAGAAEPAVPEGAIS